MKKSIIILILSFFFINNIEGVFPVEFISYENNKRQAVKQCEYFCKINIDMKGLDQMNDDLKNICEILNRNGVKADISKDDVLKDIYEQNTGFLYCKQKQDNYHMIVDMKLNNVGGETKVYVQEKRAISIYEDIKAKLGTKLESIERIKNVKVKLKDSYSVEDGKHIAEKYLSKLQCEFKSQSIQNGYVIEVMQGLNNSNKLLISVAEYKDKVVIICGEPYIYISY